MNPQGTSTVGQDYVPPSSGDISAELSAAMGLLGSTRENIAAGIDLELDDIAAALPNVGNEYIPYIEGALGEASQVYDYLRSYAKARLDGDLNTASDLWAQIEALINPKPDALTDRIGNGTMMPVGQSNGDTGALPAATGSASLFPAATSVPIYPNPVTTAVAGYSGPDGRIGGGLPTLAWHGDARQGIQPAIGWRPEWMNVWMEGGWFYSLEPTPLTRWEFTGVDGERLYYNTANEELAQPTARLPFYPGWQLLAGTAYPAGVAAQMFYGEYGQEAIDTWIKEVVESPPLGVPQLTLQPPSPAPSPINGSSNGNGPNGLPAPSPVPAGTVCRWIDFGPADAIGIVAVPGRFNLDWNEGFYGQRQVGNLLMHMSLTYVKADTIFGGLTTWVLYINDEFAYSTEAEFDAAGDLPMAAYNPTWVEQGWPANIVVHTGLCQAAPLPQPSPTPIPQPVPIVGGCPAPVINVHCSQCGQPVPGGGTGTGSAATATAEDEGEWMNELEWLSDPDSNSPMIRFAAALGGIPARIMAAASLAQVSEMLMMQLKGK